MRVFLFCVKSFISDKCHNFQYVTAIKSNFKYKSSRLTQNRWDYFCLT